MHATIRIEVVQNGYLVLTEDDIFRPQGVMRSSAGRFAFESFESMAEWLGQKLQKPETGMTRDADYPPL